MLPRKENSDLPTAENAQQEAATCHRGSHQWTYAVLLMLLWTVVVGYFFNDNRVLNHFKQLEFGSRSFKTVRTENSSWIQSYTMWHQNTVANLKVDNWKDHKFLILYCPRQGHCAGTSDRLQPAVLILRLAEQSKRLLFIRWEHPYPLEEFLVPTGAINWTMPDWLVNVTNLGIGRLPLYSPKRKLISYDNHTAIIARFNIGTQISKIHDAMEGNGAHAKIYSKAFHLLFQPSPPVANMIQERLQSAGLQRDTYAVAHARVKYKRPLPEKKKLEFEVAKAINCASQLMPGAKIYFASDAAEAKKAAQAYATQNNYSVVVFTDLEPIHLEFASNRSVQEYYPVFVDLYLLSYGQCISFGKGGYSPWANLISSNVSCASQYIGPHKCKWTEK